MGQPNPAELGPSLIAGLLQDAGTTGVFPLSFAQESLWFLEQMAPGNPAYNIPEGWRLQGRLNVAALERNLTEIFRRHETLRTVFGENEGKPVQIIKAPQPFRLPLIDLQERGDKEADVGNGLLEVAVTRHDVQNNAARQRLGGAGDVQGFGRRGEARHRARGRGHAAPRDRGLEERAKIKRGGDGQLSSLKSEV